MNKGQKNIVIFLGPPGSGKGSISQLCVKRLGWTQLSTGNLCRQHILNNTDIGQKIDFAIKSGKLISDALIIDMVKEWLHTQFDNGGSIILDGFPRTTAQAISLINLLKLPYFSDMNVIIIKMNISDETVINRLSGRTICKNNECQYVYSIYNKSLEPEKVMVCDNCNNPLVRREDDEQKSILERLRIYHKHEKDLIDFYTQSGKPITTLNVEQQLEDVYMQFLNAIGYKSV